MTRISTIGQSELLLRSQQLSQSKLLDLQRQISSGEKSDTFKGLRTDTFLLTSAQSRLGRGKQLLENNIQTKTKLDLRQQVVEEISNIARDIKAEYLKSESNEDATELKLEAGLALEKLAGLLNARDQNGNHMFAGSRTDTAPVTLTAQAGPPAFSITFNNDTVVEQANIDDSLALSFGVLATDNPAAPSGPFQKLIDVLNFFAAGVFPPPLPAENLPAATAPTVTAAQVAPLLDQAFDGVNDLNAQLGLKQQLIDDANNRLQRDIDLTERFIASIKDADIAEVFTKINQEQFALSASFQLTSELRNLSLVNFLRF